MVIVSLAVIVTMVFMAPDVGEIPTGLTVLAKTAGTAPSSETIPKTRIDNTM